MVFPPPFSGCLRAPIHTVGSVFCPQELYVSAYLTSELAWSTTSSSVVRTWCLCCEQLLRGATSWLCQHSDRKEVSGLPIIVRTESKVRKREGDTGFRVTPAKWLFHFNKYIFLQKMFKVANYNLIKKKWFCKVSHFTAGVSCQAEMQTHSQGLTPTQPPNLFFITEEGHVA